MDATKLSKALDRLMLAKNRPLLSAEAKQVWLEELKDEPMEAIAYAVKTLMRTPNGFPEVANLIESCKDWRKENKPALDRIAWERRSAELLSKPFEMPKQLTKEN